MASSKLTFIGLYNYDNSIFDNMNLPTGIEKDTLVDNILLTCGEFEVLYADNEFLKGAIGIWSKKWYRTIEKWINALSIEYDPLNNYDRTETWTDTGSGNSTNQVNRTNTETITNDTISTHSETITDDTTNTHTSTGSATDISSGSNNGSSENTVSAFDSSTYVPHDKNITSTTTSNNSTSNTTANGTDTVDNDITRNGNDTVDNDITRNGQNSSTSTENSSNTLSHTGRMFGNIGVTTSQQMLQSELDIATWNLYEHITDIFAKEFCIMIY